MEQMKFGKRKIIILVLIMIIVFAFILGYVMLKVTREAEETKETRVIENGEESVAEVVEVEAILNENNTTVNTSTWDLNRVRIVYDTNSRPVPVPVPIGYTASKVTGETKIDTGFVIYEGTGEVNDSNKDTAQTTRNQWVWVPIYDVNQIYGTDSNGNLHGKLYDFSSAGRSKLNWTENNGVMNITSSTSYREPDILTSYDTDSKLPSYISEEDRNELYEELTEGFERMIESIKKYGGFYIGRYETGGLSSKAKLVRGDSDIGDQNWYTMYRKCKTLNGTNENVKTSMIWGNQWDATLKWLVDSGSKTYGQVCSYGWGNEWGTDMLNRRPTGYIESWKANNIYDMNGNVWDWTLEAYWKDNRIMRGGVCSDRYVASDRHSGIPTSDYNGGYAYSYGLARV